jgi:hypothetical protein
VTGLNDGMEYMFRVVANGAGGTGNSESSVAFAEASPTMLPGEPMDVTLIPGMQWLHVSWTPAMDGSAAVHSYTATASPGGATCSSAMASDTDCVIAGLTAGAEYTVTVVAHSADGSSEASAASDEATVLGPTSGSVVSNANGAMQVFSRSTDNHLWTSIRDASGEWGTQVDLGYPIHSDPIAVRNAVGHLDVFALGHDHAVWHRQQMAPNSTTWTEWDHVGDAVWTSLFDVDMNEDGRLQIFGRDMSSNLRTARQDFAGSEDWTELPSLGGLIFSDPKAENIAGHLEVFVLGWNGMVWRRTQIAPNSDTWDNWEQVGAAATDIFV